ncbi:hypothetical protein V1520DRAFT_29460 [Lipomyces starkeyi]
MSMQSSMHLGICQMARGRFTSTSNGKGTMMNKTTPGMGAAYARQHSAILLQIVRPNFHSAIKKHNSGKSLRQKYVPSPISTSILAVYKNADIRSRAAHLLALGERIQEDVKRSAQNLRTQHLKESAELPQLKKFPLPVQKLIVEGLYALRHTIVIVSTNTMYRPLSSLQEVLSALPSYFSRRS